MCDIFDYILSESIGQMNKNQKEEKNKKKTYV